MINCKAKKFFINIIALTACIAGMPAVSAEAGIKRNINKTDINTRLANLELLVTKLQTQLSAANNRIAQLESSSVLQLDGILSLQTDNQGYPAATFSGANVHINNGAGLTESINGMGNLIIGYDEPRTTSPRNMCSLGEYGSPADCEANGGIWAASHKSGSHVLVIGPQHNYSSYAGLVSGHANSIVARHSNVSGGIFNVARGWNSSVNGGVLNGAQGNSATVNGGFQNSAYADISSVNGGELNIVGGYLGAIGGGRARMALGEHDWAAGTLYEDN